LLVVLVEKTGPAANRGHQDYGGPERQRGALVEGTRQKRAKRGVLAEVNHLVDVPDRDLREARSRNRRQKGDEAIDREGRQPVPEEAQGRAALEGRRFGAERRGEARLYIFHLPKSSSLRLSSRAR